ncbi:MAG: ATP-binding protein [Usitatibacter sp.]
MPGVTTLELVVALGSVSERESAARQLADRLGVERLILMIRDPQLHAMIPAPGFPQTLRGGPEWRHFVARCTSPGRFEQVVDIPPGSPALARAVISGALALVMIGGDPLPAELAVVESLLPLLSVALLAEQEAVLARGAAADAQRAAGRSHALADSLEAARAEASKLNVELREEHRRKDDFLAMLAHELRNPLSPLVTSIELLRRQRDPTPAMVHQLDIMSRQLRQLTRLVEDLLDVSRVSRGRIELRRLRLLLGEMLTDAIESARPLLDARGHSVVLHLPPDVLPLDADNVRLTQVFSNLIHNAAKYTDPSGRLEVSAAREGADAVVKFRDNGIGITEEMLPRVFDLFSQAPVSLARAQGGLGVGLTLVRALVELHGGSVTAESEGLGRGSTFTVRLPLAEGITARIAEMPPARMDATDRAMRVLIVDDNHDAADSLGDIWRLMGHHAEVAYSSIQALQVAADLEPDLVLLDIGLPEFDGYEVARRMRRILGHHARLVALTGYGSDEDRRRSREAGFDEHVVKPASPESFAGIAQRAGARALASHSAAPVPPRTPD